MGKSQQTAGWRRIGKKSRTTSLHTRPYIGIDLVRIQGQSRSASSKSKLTVGGTRPPSDRGSPVSRVSHNRLQRPKKRFFPDAAESVQQKKVSPFKARLQMHGSPTRLPHLFLRFVSPQQKKRTSIRPSRRDILLPLSHHQVDIQHLQSRP